ncbi:VOC family protein [Salegentibacter sp. HM20]
MKIPEQYLPVMPYLILKNSEEFLQFAKNVFNAETQLIVPDENGDIMHGELKIGPAIIMFGTAAGEWRPKSSAMFLYVEDVEKIYRLAINHGAKSLEKPSRKDYGFTAGFEDPFENHWYIVEAEKLA